MSDTIVVIQEVSTVTVTAPGPQGTNGVGVPTGGTDGQVLTKDSSTDFDTSWQDPGAPADAGYLVTAADPNLTNEVAVGTTPGGELGGTWASPTVDTTHSGSSHASVQAAAEATAAAALAAHEADTTAIHGITNTANLETTSGAQAKVDAHVNDTVDAHDASAISFSPIGGLAADDVQEALAELDSEKAATSHAHAGEDITSGTVADARIASTIARDSEVTSAIAALSTVYQPLDSDLTAIAALSTTPFGRSLLAAADAAGLRATLDLEAGTDFPSLTTFNDHSARHEEGGADELAITVGQMDAETSDFGQVPTSDGAGGVAWADQAGGATSADFVSVDSTNLSGVATNVQGSLEEIDAAVAGKQPLDSDLTAIAALSTTSFGRALLALADPADATKFLDGTGAYDTVKDSDLSTSDITTNNVSTSKHGFAPKLPNDATKFLNGVGSYAVPAASGVSYQGSTNLSSTDVEAALDELDTEKTTAAAALTAALTEIADQKRCILVWVTDPAGSALTTGDGKAYIPIPSLLNGHNLILAHAFLTTNSSSGTPTIQIANVTDAVDMLSTKITIDANEPTSHTAATPPVIDTTKDDVATGDILRVDIDVAGTGAKGLMVALTFEAP